MQNQKRHYSYFIVKPDGTRYLDDICNTIESKFQTVRYYAIEDFSSIIKQLYHTHYEKKGTKFSESFESFLYGLGELFGNEAVLILVSDSTRPYPELMQSVFDTKQEIRKKHVNNQIGIVTNYGKEKNSFLKLVSLDGSPKNQRIMCDAGAYRLNDMNTIHCPDPDLETTLDELTILLSSGIINDKNLIPQELLDNMKKYRTAAFQSDMKLPGYDSGYVSPDLSGFIKGEILKETTSIDSLSYKDDENSLEL